MRQKERQRQWWWWQWWWSCELCECVCVYVCACVWVNLFVCGAKWINGLIEKFVLTTRVSLCAVNAVDKLSDYLQSCHTDPTATLFKYLCMCDAPIAGIFDFDTFFEHFEMKEISISCCPMNYWSNRRHSKSANQREPGRERWISARNEFPWQLARSCLPSRHQRVRRLRSTGALINFISICKFAIITIISCEYLTIPMPMLHVLRPDRRAQRVGLRLHLVPVLYSPPNAFKECVEVIMRFSIQ